MSKISDLCYCFDPVNLRRKNLATCISVEIPTRTLNVAYDTRNRASE